MSLSKFPALAVFFMMVLSAVVSIPNYYVEAEEDNDKSGAYFVYIMTTERSEAIANATPLSLHFSAPPMSDNSPYELNQICVGDDEIEGIYATWVTSSGGNAGDFNNITSWSVKNTNGLELEKFVYNPMSDIMDFEHPMVVFEDDENSSGGHISAEVFDQEEFYCSGEEGNGPVDDGEVNPDSSHFDISMMSLGEWDVNATIKMPGDWSNGMRENIANMCADMMDSDGNEVTQECFDYWVEMRNSDDGYGGGGYNDGFCPPEMDDETCRTMMECSENDDMNMDCMRAMYIYCYENEDSEMCEGFMNSSDGDNNGQFVWGIMAYEAGHIDAEFLMDEYIVPEFGDMMNGGTGSNGPGNAVLYDVQTFNADSDGELIIVPDFMMERITTPDFVCGDGETIGFRGVNDDYGNCDDGADEQWYDNNTSDDLTDDCQEWNNEDCEGEEVNWFDCHDGSEIWINQVNNWEWDCEDGEDEYQELHNSWWGEVYLFEGDYSAGLSDIENLENVAFSTSYSSWGDENKTYVDYDSFIEVGISAGTWSLVTTGNCYQEWGEDDEGNYGRIGYDCHGENDNHTNSGSYSHKLEFGDESWLVNGSLDYESMEMANFPYIDNYGGDKEEFSMYQTQLFSIDTDSSVMISSAGWNCDDYGGDGVDDYCWGQSPGLYIYHGDDLVASNKHYYNEDMYCSIDSADQDYSNCQYAMLEVDLVAGDYTVYTTFNNEASYYNNIDGAYVVIEGEESNEWDGYMVDNRWEWDDEDNRILVEGTADRKHMPMADQAKYEPDCYDDEGNEIDCEGVIDMFVYMFMIAENATHYEAGNLTAEEAANNSVDLFYTLVEMGIFEQEDDGHDGSDHAEWDSFSYCEWEGADWEDIDMWYCDEDGDEEDFEDWWYYCERETEPNHMWYCTDDFGQSSDYYNSMDNTHHADGTMPSNHGDDIESVILDGIVGLIDPSDWTNFLVLSQDNLVGSLSDNEDMAIMSTSSFKLSFDGVDDGLKSHSLEIPTESNTTFNMMVLEGYELISCSGCETEPVISDDGMSMYAVTNQPVVVSFGKVVEEDTTECDQIIAIAEGGYSFEPAEVAIAVGDTVCWIWNDTVDSHNVVEIISEFDADLNLTEASVGFESGITATTMDFRHTFTEDDTTHYYVCEPHATMGMVGKVTVGNGSADDKVPEALEESGLPNISFIVGALVLVGAAGLRRRIH